MPVSAQVDTIAHAAATLRHEINNPLFAITGSAESALKRLQHLKAQYPESEQDFNILINGMKRIQRGSSRIEKSMHAFLTTPEAPEE